MPSTPLIACSSGVVTAVSTSCALAPVYTALTEICGGASAGYCATGIVGIATTPARMMTSEQTDARIGLVMNVLTNIIQAASFGLDGRAVANLLDARDDQLLAPLETAVDGVFVVADLADGDRALPRDQT